MSISEVPATVPDPRYVNDSIAKAILKINFVSLEFNDSAKAGIFAVNTWKPLSILEKLRWLNHHFIIKKNKRLNTRLRKPNYESSLVAIYYKVEENYFKGKIWVLHKLKTKTSGKAYSFEIIFAHFCHDSNVSHFTFRKSIEVFSVK